MLPLQSGKEVGRPVATGHASAMPMAAIKATAAPEAGIQRPRRRGVAAVRADDTTGRVLRSHAGQDQGGALGRVESLQLGLGRRGPVQQQGMAGLSKREPAA